MDPAPHPTEASLEVFFDGACPFCTREVAVLRRLDRKGRVRFTDLAAQGFDPAVAGVPMADLMDRIHARLPDGGVVAGVEVFRRIYTILGFGPLVAATRLPGLSQLLDVGYRWFAKNRLRLGGRCTEQGCAVGTLRPTAARAS
jgi:predicted DCC family thiol-disulfide oxidoreductase YuxK